MKVPCFSALSVYRVRPLLAVRTVLPSEALFASLTTRLLVLAAARELKSAGDGQDGDRGEDRDARVTWAAAAW